MEQNLNNTNDLDKLMMEIINSKDSGEGFLFISEKEKIIVLRISKPYTTFIREEMNKIKCKLLEDIVNNIS